MSPHEKSSKKSNPKPLGTNGEVRLGELLRNRRNELEISLEDAETATKIRQKYLELLESDKLQKLPNDVYTRGYVKNYAEFLGFDTKEVLKLYTSERHRQASNAPAPSEKLRNPLGLRPIDSQSVIFTPKSIIITLAAILILGLFTYVGWQFSQLSAPPKISLNNQDQSTVNTSFVIVSGDVDSGSDVFINDSPILSTAEGSFSERVALADGTNQIKVSAKNKFGKESSKTILVTTKLSKQSNDQTVQMSNATFDGVEMTVKITDQAAWIVVQTDGQDAFRGTMLPGTQQTFKAKQNIKLTTSNAGSTDVILTNTIELKKDLGTLGKEGEAKQDLIFSKDTNIQ